MSVIKAISYTCIIPLQKQQMFREVKLMELFYSLICHTMRNNVPKFALIILILAEPRDSKIYYH